MGRITQEINIAKTEFNKNLYFREDISRLIGKLRTCIEKKQSDTQKIVEADILKMFSSHGIELERNLTPDQFEEQLIISDIPSVEYFYELCWEEMIKVNAVYKTPKEYMQRLVDKLVYPEYNLADSTIRVKILKQILGNLGSLEGTSFYSEQLSDIVKSEYNGDVSGIGDEIFDNYMEDRHYEKNYKVIEAIINAFGNDFYAVGEYDAKLFSLVSQIEKIEEEKSALDLINIIQANIPTKTAKQSRKKSKAMVLVQNSALADQIKEHLENVLKAYKERYDEEFSAISKEKNRGKQFILIYDFIRQRGLVDLVFTDELNEIIAQKLKINGLEANELLEFLKGKATERPAAFARINTYIIKQIRKIQSGKNKEYKKGLDRARAKEEGIKLLHVCNDLAEGTYKKSTEMKEMLYLFAFAFDMSVKAGKEDSNPFKDVNKNLFEDYYCDNIMRYISGYQKVGQYEEPAGLSIQFKNFVEIVYLYWLNKDSAVFTPAEKYTSANKMIETIVSEKKKAQEIVSETKKNYSEEYFRAKKLVEVKGYGSFEYRNMVETDQYYGDESLKIEDYLDLPEHEFLKIILEKYDVDTQKDYSTHEAFENQSCQVTVKEAFKDLIDGLTKGYRSKRAFISTIHPLDFYKSTFDESTNPKNYDVEASRKLSALVDKINEQMVKVLGDAYDGICEPYTRTRYMYLYYFDFIISRSYDGYSDPFDVFYEDFCEPLNIDLERFSYQKFTEKNLIDMMLLYSAFIFLRA